MKIRKQKEHETWSEKTLDLIIILGGKNQENDERLDVYIVLSK